MSSECVQILQITALKALIITSSLRCLLRNKNSPCIHIMISNFHIIFNKPWFKLINCLSAVQDVAISLRMCKFVLHCTWGQSASLRCGELDDRGDVKRFISALKCHPVALSKGWHRCLCIPFSIYVISNIDYDSQKLKKTYTAKIVLIIIAVNGMIRATSVISKH